MITQSGGVCPKNSYDVVIIGAGPAGSTAAYILAANGFKVLIVDKSAFPRDKLCGGLLTFKSIQLLEDIFSMPLDLLQSRRLITFQSSSYQVGNSTGASVKGRLNYPFHFVRRKDYDGNYLSRPGYNHVLLLGDACGLADPFYSRCRPNGSIKC